eukprot:gene10495-8461_t
MSENGSDSYAVGSDESFSDGEDEEKKEEDGLEVEGTDCFDSCIEQQPQPSEISIQITDIDSPKREPGSPQIMDMNEDHGECTKQMVGSPNTPTELKTFSSKYNLKDGSIPHLVTAKMNPQVWTPSPSQGPCYFPVSTDKPSWQLKSWRRPPPAESANFVNNQDTRATSGAAMDSSSYSKPEGHPQINGQGFNQLEPASSQSLEQRLLEAARAPNVLGTPESWTSTPYILRQSQSTNQAEPRVVFDTDRPRYGEAQSLQHTNLPDVSHYKGPESAMAEAGQLLTQARKQQVDILGIADRAVEMWKEKFYMVQKQLLNDGSEMQEATSRAEKAENEAERLHEQLQEEQKRCEDIKEELEDAIQACSEAAKKLEVANKDKEVYDKRAQDAESKSSEVSASAAGLQRDLDALNLERDSLISAKERAEETAASSRAEIESSCAASAAAAQSAQDEVARLQEALDTEKQQKVALIEETEARSDQLISMKQEVETAKQQVQSESVSAVSSRKQLASASRALDNVRSEVTQLSSALADQQAQSQRKRVEVAEQQRELESCSLLINSLRSQLSDQISLGSSLERRVQELEEELEHAGVRCSSLAADNNELRIQLDASEQAARHLRQALEEEGRQGEALASAAAEREVYMQGMEQENQQLHKRLACMMGQEDAISPQPLETLESLASLLENALPRIRTGIMEKRVQEARNEVSESTLCGVCLAGQRDTFLMPCGHIICRICAERLDICPICRTTITGRNRAFV